MATLGEKAVIGGKEYVVTEVMGEPNVGLLRVAEQQCGETAYRFNVPVVIWDAAVRGALHFPTDEELKKLKDACEGTHWEMCDLREAADSYIEALEARVRKLEDNQEG